MKANRLGEVYNDENLLAEFIHVDKNITDSIIQGAEKSPWKKIKNLNLVDH